jgi:hypothetical protein
MMSNYDRWVTREPEWRTEEPPPPAHCEVCGCFLPLRPDRTDERSITGKCPGAVHSDEYGYYGRCYGSEGEITGPHEAHTWQEYDGVNLVTQCRYCRHYNTTVDY